MLSVTSTRAFSCRGPVTIGQMTHNLGPGGWVDTVPSPWAIPVSSLFGYRCPLGSANFLAPSPGPDP